MVNNNLNVNVLIVGAGPAGISAAITLQKAGIDVLVVDRATFPRTKLCAGLLTAKGQDSLKRLLGNELAEECLAASFASKHKELVFYRKKERLVAAPLLNCILLVNRLTMDNWLVSYYKKIGGHIIENDGIRTIESNASTVTTSKGITIKYTQIIVADGANSKLRHLLRPKENRPKILSLEVNIPHNQCSIDGVNIYFDIVPKTYAWVFGKGKTTCIGMSKFPGESIDILSVFRSFLKDLNVKSVEAIAIKGATIPYDKRPLYHMSPNVFFAGDAAGTVEPMTLEGISYALQSGQEVADVILRNQCISVLKRNNLGNGRIVQKYMMENQWFMTMFYKHAPHHASFISRFYNEYIDNKPTLGSFRMLCIITEKIFRHIQY